MSQGNTVRGGKRVTRLAARVAQTIWPGINDKCLADVALGVVGCELCQPVCNIVTLVRQLLDVGVLIGRIGENVARLRRGSGRLIVMATLCDREAAPIGYLDLNRSGTHSAALDLPTPTVPLGQVISQVQYETLQATWVHTCGGKLERTGHEMAGVISIQLGVTASAIKSRWQALVSMGLLKVPKYRSTRFEFPVKMIHYQRCGGSVECAQLIDD